MEFQHQRIHLTKKFKNVPWRLNTRGAVTSLHEQSSESYLPPPRCPRARCPGPWFSGHSSCPGGIPSPSRVRTPSELQWRFLHFAPEQYKLGRGRLTISFTQTLTGPGGRGSASVSVREPLFKVDWWEWSLQNETQHTWPVFQTERERKMETVGAVEGREETGNMEFFTSVLSNVLCSLSS